MRMTNNTQLPDAFVRRVVRWVVSQLDAKMGLLSGFELKLIKSRIRSHNTLLGSSLEVRLGRQLSFEDATKCLVNSLAWGLPRVLRLPMCNWHAAVVQKEFEKSSNTLLSHWSASAGLRLGTVDMLVDDLMEDMEKNDPQIQAERRAASMRLRMEKRSVRAKANLTEWQRRLKLANTKVKKYRKRVAYYDRRLNPQQPQGGKHESS